MENKILLLETRVKRIKRMYEVNAPLLLIKNETLMTKKICEEILELVKNLEETQKNSR